jgi:hypothetical protein
MNKQDSSTHQNSLFADRRSELSVVGNYRYLEVFRTILH